MSKILSKKNKKVLVGLTGDYSSAVAAFLLKKQGYEVMALVITPQNDYPFLDIPHVDSQRVKEICNILSIPIYATKVAESFKEFIIDPYLESKAYLRYHNIAASYHNLVLKKIYEKMKLLDCEYMSTGHYAKIQFNIENRNMSIYGANDHSSDQSYLLAGVNSDIVNNLILPLGEILASDVAKIFNKFINMNLPDKEIFTTESSLESFLQKNISKEYYKEVEIRSTDEEEVYGQNDGTVNLDIGMSLEDVIPGISGPSKVNVILGKTRSSVVLAGPQSSLTYQSIQISNLVCDQALLDSYCLDVEIKFGDYIIFHSGILNIKSNGTAFFISSAPMENVYLGDSVVIYVKEASLHKVLANGDLTMRFNSLSNSRLKQIGGEDELEPSTFDDFRF